MLVYQVESSLWLWSIYFLLHCFSRLLKCLWAVLEIQFSLEGVPGRPISSWAVSSCLRWAAHSQSWCCNESWLVSITFDSGQRLGCLEGKLQWELTELCFALWDCSPSTSLDRSAEEMGRERVDAWTAAVFTRRTFLKGHLFIFDWWFVAVPRGETSVLGGRD